MTNLQSEPVEHPATRSQPFDPFDGLAALREERPLARMRYPDGQIGWLVTSHALAREVLSDSRFGFGVELTRALVDAEKKPTRMRPPKGMFSVMNPPEHTFYRRKLASAFNPRQVRLLEHRIEEIVARRIDAMRRRGGPLDLVEEFTAPVALETLYTVLGIRVTDAQSLRQAQQRLLSSDVERSTAAWQWLNDHFREHVRTKRTEPGPDLLTALLADDDLSEQEVATMCAVMITGGDDTPNAIAVCRRMIEWGMTPVFP